MYVGKKWKKKNNVFILFDIYKDKKLWNFRDIIM